MLGLKSKEWFTFFVITLFLVDIVILLDIPFLRSVFAFLYFTTIPGLLILYILKINKIEFVKKFVLSIGLSIAFLMFVGLFINTLYPLFGISKPLSTRSLVVSFAIIMVILSFVAYKRNKDDFRPFGILDIELNLKKDQFISPLLFPIIFPFLAILGTYFMNTQGNNTILMVMLFLIPIYVVLVVYFRERIPKVVYPIAILMISIALLLSYGLTSNYVNGADVHNELYAFKVVTSNFYWSMSNYNHVLTACLSVSLLPAIYQSLLNINNCQYMYKLVYQLIFSITPLVVYIISKKYINECYAFLASVFFISQLFFIYTMQSAVRQGIAIFFFALGMMVIFSNEISGFNKKMLFLIFMFSVIVSHYSTAYVMFILMFLSSLVIAVSSIQGYLQSNRIITIVMGILCFVAIFFWYSQVTQTSSNVENFIVNTFKNLGNFFIEESRRSGTMAVIGKGGLIETLPQKIRIVIYDTTFAFILIGFFYLSRNCKERSKLDTEYFLGMVISLGLLASMIIVPYISTYSTGRLYQQMLVFLALAFVMGGDALSKFIRKPQLGLLIILIVLILQFFSVTYVTDQILGVPTSMVLNRDGIMHDTLYIYDQEVFGAKWLLSNGNNDLMVYTDSFGAIRLIEEYNGKLPKISSDIFSKNETTSEGYIYLRHANIVSGEVYLKGSPTGKYLLTKNLTAFNHLFIRGDKIYNSGSAEVWK